MPASRCSESSSAVSRMKYVYGAPWRDRTQRHSSTPSMRGIIQSLTTTSAPRELYRSSASAPLVAQLGAWPRSVTTFWTSERTLGSSSAMRIWMGGASAIHMDCSACATALDRLSRLGKSSERLFYAVGFNYGSGGVRGSECRGALFERQK